MSRPANQPCLTITVEDAGRLLGISRGHAYELVRRGELPAIRLGRRLVIPTRAIEELLGAATAKRDETSAPHPAPVRQT